jgi:uroporphyrinogen decarboxylase
LEAHQLSHRARLESCLSGEPPDRTPIALWRHFPVDDQSPESLARAIIAFQQSFDFDLVKVTPASSFCLKDWGAVDEWRGNTEGTRDYGRRVVDHPEDWLKLTVLDPYHGYLGNQLICLKIVCDELSSTVPVLQTIFSPLSQAKNLVGGQKLLAHIRQYPNEVMAGLKIISESTIKFIDAIRHMGIAGIFYAVQHANFHLLAPDEYLKFGRPLDIEILNTVGDLWLNMLHLHGENIMFEQFTDYPVQVINWHDRDTYPDLAQGQILYPGVVCGGLQRSGTMELGTPERVYSEARDALLATDHKRLILGTGCVLPITTPRANIMAAIKSCRG